MAAAPRTRRVLYCQRNDITVEAYSPLAKAAKLSDPTVLRIAARRQASVAQVLIAWSLAKGMHTMPKSVSEERIKANLLGATLELTSGDVAKLDALEEGLVTGWDPVRDAPV